MDSRSPDHTIYPESISSPGSGFYDAPELAVQPGLYPYVPDKIHAPFGDPSSYDNNDKEVVTAQQEPHGDTSVLSGSKLWYKRRRTWAIGLITVIVIIAAVVGAVVGVNASNRTSS
jgi:hypothetical protein